MKDILKGSAIVFAFKVIGAISLFGVHLLIARYYGSSVLGVFNLILAILAFGSILSKLGLDMYVVRILPEIENDKIQTSGFLQQVFKLLFFGSLVSAFLILFISPFINQYIFKSFDASTYLYFLVAIMLPFTYFNVIPEIFRGFHDVKIYSFFRGTAQNFLMLITLVLTIFVFRQTYSPVYIYYVVLVILTIIMGLILYKFLLEKNINLFTNATYDKAILKFSYPMLFTSSLMFFMGNVDSFMISYYLDESQVGIYAACLKLSLLVTFVLASINGFIAPKISKAYAVRNFDEIKRIYYNSVKIILSVSTPIFCILFIFPEFFLGLFGEEFTNATTTLIIITLAFAINAFVGSVGYLLNMTDNQHLFMRVLMVGLVLNIIFNVLLIPKYGIAGAAIATLISMSVWNLSSLIILKKKNII